MYDTSEKESFSTDDSWVPIFDKHPEFIDFTTSLSSDRNFPTMIKTHFITCDGHIILNN